MNTFKLSNISLGTMRAFLHHQGLKHIRTAGGHETYCKQSLRRPIIIQSHIDPVPEFVVLNAIKPLGFNKKSFNEYLIEHKIK